MFIKVISFIIGFIGTCLKDLLCKFEQGDSITMHLEKPNATKMTFLTIQRYYQQSRYDFIELCFIILLALIAFFSFMDQQK
jgi:uncharacterized membrane protein